MVSPFKRVNDSRNDPKPGMHPAAQEYLKKHCKHDATKHLGSTLGPNASDLALIRRANRMGWPVPQHMKDLGIANIERILKGKDIELKLKATKVLQEIDGMNSEIVKDEFKMQRLEGGLSTENNGTAEEALAKAMDILNKSKEKNK